MLIEITTNQLLALVLKQIEALFFLEDKEKKILSDMMGHALKRCEFCFSNTENKYYKKTIKHILIHTTLASILFFYIIYLIQYLNIYLILPHLLIGFTI